MKLAALTVAVALVASVLWLAGEQHRENCIRANQTACSVLPWKSGHPKPKKRPSILDEGGGVGDPGVGDPGIGR